MTAHRTVTRFVDLDDTFDPATQVELDAEAATRAAAVLAAPVLAPTTAARNTIQPTANGVPALTLVNKTGSPTTAWLTTQKADGSPMIVLGHTDANNATVNIYGENSWFTVGMDVALTPKGAALMHTVNDWPVTNSAHDILCIFTNNAAGGTPDHPGSPVAPPTLGIGWTTPQTAYRLVIQGPGTVHSNSIGRLASMGTLGLYSSAGQTGDPLAVFAEASDVTKRFRVQIDGSTSIQASSTTALVVSNNSPSALFTVDTTASGVVRATVGGMSVGPAAGAAPSATLDVVNSGANASLKVRANANLQILARSASAAAEIRTQNLSTLDFGTNDTAALTISVNTNPTVGVGITAPGIGYRMSVGAPGTGVDAAMGGLAVVLAAGQTGSAFAVTSSGGYEYVNIDTDGILNLRPTGLGSATVIATKLSTDTASRWTVSANGSQSWGNGTDAADTGLLYRSAAGVLQLDTTQFRIQRTNPTDIGFAMQTTAGDTTPRLQVNMNGTLQWGPGNTAADLLMYRTSVGRLQIDGAVLINSSATNALVVGSMLTVNGTAKTFTLQEAANFVLGTTTGTKMGTATTNKFGLWGVTPVVQPTAVTLPTGGTVQDAEMRTAFASLVSKLQSFGALA